MKLSSYVLNLTGKSVEYLFWGPKPRVELRSTAAGVQSIDGWNVPGFAKPSDADIAAALAAPEPPAPVPVPSSISRRQFFQQLAATPAPADSTKTIITTAEALAAMGGSIPSELATLISGLPSAEQFSASMLVAGATQFDRANSFTAAIGAAYHLTSAQIDTIWIAASAL